MSGRRTCRVPALVLAVGAAAATASAWASGPEPAASRGHRELNIVPIAGGDSDVGVGFGEVGDWARLAPGVDPYKWRLESGAFITFKHRAKFIIPFQDYYFLLTLPHLGAGGRWRLDVRPAFTDETTLKYFGLGNASPVPNGGVAADHEYGRIHPTLLVEARLRLGRGFFARFGSVYTHNWLSVRPQSLLATQRDSGTPDQQRLLGELAPHGVELVVLGLEYDTRDGEVVTQHGSFHALKVRLSPRLGDVLPYRYAQVNGTARWYATPIERWWTVSARLMADVLVGSPPFYELARIADETPGIGGVRAIRGVPAQRYYGKVKLLANLETRSEVFKFEVRRKPYGWPWPRSSTAAASGPSSAARTPSWTERAWV